MCRFLLHNSSDGSRGTDGVIIDASAASMFVAGSASEVSRSVTKGSGGAAQPRNFLDFKRANYPGIRIKSLQFKLSLYMMYQMNPVTFMWFISTYLVPENNFYFKHSSKYTS